MQRRRFSIFLVVALTIASSLDAGGRSKEKVLYRFTGKLDGAYPSSGLLIDTAGNLYGTTEEGGALGCGYSGSGCGVVFELTPSGNGRWLPQVLYAFQGGADGNGPGGNLALDASGNIYGTTALGGSNSCGTVFELSPGADGLWTETVLHTFGGTSDGCLPEGLTLDASGNLYGVTQNGGSLIYELSPPQQKGGSWTETILYNMGYVTWAAPNLLFDSKGTLHDTWYPNFCCGGVFELKRVGLNWQEKDLYDFRGGGNGEEPQSGVVLDNEGRMYGTAFEGGNNQGLAFELERDGKQWKVRILYVFCRLNDCADGAYPEGPLQFGQGGSLYGTASEGGTGCPHYGCGVVFKLTHSQIGWRETVLHRFQGEPDGSGPADGVILDGKGNLYGTTVTGGRAGPNGGYGTVFEVMP
jgi:uncharacterized repeat protein (TIGR03803 family)